MESKKSFILYTDNYEAIRSLTYEQKGRLLDAAYLYEMGEELPEMDAVTAMAFSFIRISLDRDNGKWEEIRQKRVEAGRKGRAAKIKQNEQVPANADNCQQVSAVNVNVNDNVNVNVIDIIPSTKVDVSDLGSDAAVTPQDVVRAWNSITAGIWGTLQSISASSTRWKMVRARIASEGWEGFRAAIETATKSEYLTSGEATWFSFDWFIKPNNFVKVRDGNYLTTTTKTHNNGKCTTDTQRRRGAAIDIAGFTEEDYSEPL